MSLAAVAAAASPYFLFGQSQIKHTGDSWTREYSGTLPAAARLRVNGNGPVNITGGQSSRQISYTVTVTVAARSEAQARRILERLPVRAGVEGGWAVLNAPGGAAISTTVVHAPRLEEVVVRSSNGAVQGHSIDGAFDVETAAQRTKHFIRVTLAR